MRHRLARYAGGALVLSIACAIPVGVYVGYHQVVNSRWFLVRDVQIEGNVRVPDEAILEAAGLDRPRNVLTCDAEEMAATISALAWVRDATVTIHAPGQVLIAVTETAHVATAMLSGPMLVDADGASIRAWTLDDDMDVPLLVGFPAEDGVLAAEAFEQALAATDALARAGAPRVAELHHDRVNGLRAVLVDGTEVRMGDDRFDERAARLMDVYRVLGAQGRQAEYVVLEGESLGRVAVKLRADEAGVLGEVSRGE